jgi:hypothetical protein
MKLPSETVSSETLISYAVYTAVKLSAKKDTKELALPIRNAIDDLNHCKLCYFGSGFTGLWF